MENFIVATDFSKGSSNAIKIAREMAKKFNAKITYLHAYRPALIDPNIPVGMVDEVYRSENNEIEKSLSQLTDEDKVVGQESDFIVAFGSLVDAIEEITAKQSIDCVLMGQTGQTGILTKFFGSTASQVLHEIHAPLLIIPENFDGNIFDKLAYASQLQFEEMKKMLNFGKLAQHSNKPLDIININADFDLHIFDNKDFIKEIKENLGDANYQIIAQNHPNFISGILDYIQKNKVSLLAVCSRKRNFLSQIILPSQTEKLIEQIKIPVLVYGIQKHQDI